MHREQLKNTDATISCIVPGLTRELEEVKWTNSDNTEITSDQDGYDIEDRTSSDGSLTTTLTVDADHNDQDTTYNCVIKSNEHAVEHMSTPVNLKVFSKSLS